MKTTRNLRKHRSEANYARLERHAGDTGRAREASKAANKAERKATKEFLATVDFEVDCYV